ncbi:hypothetical protein D3C87_2079140 [compost metagenome]
MQHGAAITLTAQLWQHGQEDDVYFVVTEVYQRDSGRAVMKFGDEMHGIGMGLAGALLQHALL